MGSSVVDPDLRLALVLLVLTALAAAAGRFSGLGEQRPVLVAAVRAGRLRLSFHLYSCEADVEAALRVLG